MNLLKLLIISILFSFYSNICLMSSDDNTSLNVGADIMSRYIFRGTDYGNSPSFQPTLAIKTGDFEVGYWGAIAMNSFYQEIDLYLKYNIGDLAIILTDYYIPSITGQPASQDTRYFTIDDKTTSHTLEGALSYQFGENFPLKLFGSVFFYGNDKGWGYDQEKDSKERTYYSMYFEAGYAFNIAGNNFDLFIGLTPTAGAFGNTFGVVNLGATGTKNVKITNDFILPVKASVIYNPQASLINFIFGISL